LLRRVGDGERAGDRGDATLRRGIAIAARYAHQRHVRTHIDYRAAAGFDDGGNAEAATEEGAVEVELDRPPEFVERRLDGGVVRGSRTPGIVVQDVQP